MTVKILIQRKVQPGKEEELSAICRMLRTQAMHAEGFISGEALRSIEDTTVHLVISTWKSIEDWNKWYNSPDRKEARGRMDIILAEPTKISSYNYE